MGLSGAGEIKSVEITVFPGFCAFFSEFAVLFKAQWQLARDVFC